MALLDHESAPPSLIFDINQIDTSLTHMLNKLRTELDDVQDETSLPETPDFEKFKNLEKEISESKQILKESIESYSVCKEQVQKIENATALTRNLVCALQFALEKICSIVSVHVAETEKTDLDTHVKLLKEQIVSVETLINKTYNQKSATLTEKMVAHKQRIKLLYNSYQSIKEVSLVHLCPICISNSVSSFLIPCGHTYCDSCIKKIRGLCFICRQEVQRFSPLYFN